MDNNLFQIPNQFVNRVSRAKLEQLKDEELFQIARNRENFRDLIIDFVHTTGVSYRFKESFLSST
jgi:hypothetical protein